MDKFTETIISIDKNNFTPKQVVSILLLCVSKIDINTISEMARSEKKTPRGIRESMQYKKIEIGKQKLAIKGIYNDDLPF